jgi:hypothetical protein
MSQIRIWHTYLGIFIAPSVLFFCLTGSLQLFSLHEAHGKYTPAPILEKLAKLHKDQVFEQKRHESEAPAADSAATEQPAAAEEDEDKKSLPTMILKVFFLVVAVSLITSTLLGLWMAMKNARRRGRYWLLFGLGAAIPTVLALI